MARGAARYLSVLRHGHASRPFGASVVGRLPVAMAPLSILLLVRAERGTYAFAGLVTGGFALGVGVSGPWWAARVDRLGQTRVLLGTSLASAALLASVALLAVAAVPGALLVATAVLAGATFPPLGPAMRATWVSAMADPGLRQVAYALDAVAVESIFVVGPLLVSLLLALGSPVLPLVATALLLGAGGVAYSLMAAVRRQGPRRPVPSVADERRDGHEHRSSVLRTAGVPAVLAVTLAVSVGFGEVDTSLAATARLVLGDPARVGLLFAAIAGGSVVGGLVYGALTPTLHEHLRLPVLLGLFACGLAPLAVLLHLTQPALWVLLPLLFLAGLAVAPSLIITQNLMGRLTSIRQVSEAQAWLSTAGTAGNAAGTAAAGVLVDRLGVGWSFAAASAAVAAGSLVSVTHRRRWTAQGRNLPPVGESAAPRT